MSEQERITRAAGTVGFGTLLSRILGFIREMVIAALTGTGLASDAFFVAFRIPNLLRRLLGEGAFGSAFVPVFTEELHKKGKKEAFRLAQVIFSFQVIIFTLITLLGIIFAPFIVKLIAYGFIESPYKLSLTITLTRIMFPFIFLVGLAAFAMGILDSLKNYFVPAVAPAFLNISIILCGLFLGARLKEPVLGLALGVVVGGGMQFLVQVPALFKKGFNFRWLIDFQHQGAKKIVFLMLPALVASGAEQINHFIDTILASLLFEGSVSYLYYGNRLVQFPLAIVGIAMSTAILPILSEYAARKDFSSFKKTLNFSLRFVLFISIPAALSLIVLRTSIVNIAYQRGKFTSFSRIGTETALFYYSFGLWAFAGLKVITAAFYSLHDAKTPVFISIYSIILNIILNIILMIPLKHGGLALATSLSAMFNFFLLFLSLRKKIGRIGAKRICVSTLQYLSAAFFMGIVIISFNHLFFRLGNNLTLRLGVLSVNIFLGLGSYLYVSYLLKIEEFFYVKEIFLKKFIKD